MAYNDSMGVGDMVKVIRIISPIREPKKDVGIILEIHKEKFKRTRVVVYFPNRNSNKQMTYYATYIDVLSKNSPTASFEDEESK